MITFGSGQTNGLPLAVTTAAQTLHTAPAGSATPNRISIKVTNLDTAGHTLTVQVLNSSAIAVETLTIAVPARALSFDALAPAPGGNPIAAAQPGELVLNGTAVLKVLADASGVLTVAARVDDQADVAGVANQILTSGLIASVQNAARYGVGTGIGGVGTATIANAQVVMPRAGTIQNLLAVSDGTIANGATVTVAVFKNGSATGLSIALTATNTTVPATLAAAISVAAGDLITFGVTTNNAGAPVANIQAAAEFV